MVITKKTTVRFNFSPEDLLYLYKAVELAEEQDGKDPDTLIIDLLKQYVHQKNGVSDGVGSGNGDDGVIDITSDTANDDGDDNDNHYYNYEHPGMVEKNLAAVLLDKLILGFKLTLACEHQTMCHYKEVLKLQGDCPEVFCEKCQKYHQIVEVKPTNFRVTEHSCRLY